MKWDGQAYAEDIKEALYLFFADTDLSKADIYSNNELSALLKEKYSDRIEGIRLKNYSVVVYAEEKGVRIDFQRMLNNLGDSIIELGWGMAARHIRAWAMENKVTTQYSIEWDGTQHYDTIKTALMEMLTDKEKEQAAKMSAEEFSSVLKEHYNSYDGYRGAEQSEIRYINRNPNKIEFCIPDKGSDTPREYAVSVPWEMAAGHIVSWIKEEKPKSETERKWDETHLCGGIYGGEHCENLLYSTPNLAEYNGKALDVWCIYCTASGKAKK